MNIRWMALTWMMACAGLASGARAADGGPVRVTVTISDVASDEGVMQVGLYVPDGFPDKGKEVVGATVEATAGTMVVELEAPAAGTYAVAIFHDVNANGELDKNMLGVPKESYAFSNDVFGLFGPPSFDKASFVLEGDTELSIAIGK